MTDYIDLVDKIRSYACKEYPNCDGCDMIGHDCRSAIERQATDAIEELQGRVKVLEKIAYKWCDAVPKWIPVTESLPEEGTAVNVVWVNHSPVIYYQDIKDKPQTATGVYYRGKWYWWSAVVQDYLAEYGEWEPDKMDVAIEVTHWMPIPEPPKEKGDDQISLEEVTPG